MVDSIQGYSWGGDDSELISRVEIIIMPVENIDGPYQMGTCVTADTEPHKNTGRALEIHGLMGYSGTIVLSPEQAIQLAHKLIDDPDTTL